MEEEKKPVQKDTEKKEEEFTTNKLVWIIGGIILLLIGWFGFQAIMGSSQSYKLTLIDAPKEVIKGNIATFTWRIDGPSTPINSTVVYMGLESSPGDLGTKVTPAEAKYTDFVKDFADGTYDIPLQFIGNIKMDKEGVYYFRVYTPIKDKHYWSEEYTFEVTPVSAAEVSASPTVPVAL